MSSFQLHFADHDILTPGDAPDVLVAMNPAALKANLAEVPRGATIILNEDAFTKRIQKTLRPSLRQRRVSFGLASSMCFRTKRTRST